MPEKGEATKIERNIYETERIYISEENGTKNIILKDMLNINNGDIEIDSNAEKVGEEYKLWVKMSNESVESYINILLQDYKTRTKLIDAIVSNLIENDINGISVDFKNVATSNMMRFIIELAPKLREIGITTCIVLNDGINEQDYINIVDYIVE